MAHPMLNKDLDGPEIGTLVVIVDKGRNLPNRRSVGKQDPYCNARLGKEAKKTTADKRGGQTPRWDQELRFTVLDSLDYYTLKVSIFDLGKKTELVGDAAVDLGSVIVPGGGEAEIWQELKCKGKYAGEVRMELTYYDSRPKVEKSVARKAMSESLDDIHSPSTSLRSKETRRRPLPGNPVAGPRGYGTPPQPSSVRRRSAYNNDLPQPVYYEQPQIQSQPIDEPDPFTQYSQQGQDYHDYPQDQMHQQDDYYIQEPPDFLPQLPPLHTSRSATFNRPQHDNYQPSPRIPPPLEHSHSAPLTTNHYEEPNFDDDFLQHPSPGHDMQSMVNEWEHSLQYDQEQQYHDYGQPQELVDLPPPPPAHRQVSSYVEPQQHTHTSPVYRGNDRSWHHNNDNFHSTAHVTPPRDPLGRARGHLTSRSEIQLARYTDSDESDQFSRSQGGHSSLNRRPVPLGQDDMVLQHYRRSSEDRHHDTYGYQQTSQISPVRKEVPRTPHSRSSFSNDAYGQSQVDRRDSYHSVSSAGTNTRSSRHQPHHSQTYPALQSPQYTSPYGSQAVNGSYTQLPNPSPTRPHPLSQAQNLSSYSIPQLQDNSNFDDSMPVIKPLAIPSRKSQPPTPGSVERQSRPQVRSATTRKSVSPRPVSSDGRPAFSPFSPDSFDALNPSVQTTPVSQNGAPAHTGPIVDFHGNVIDPSDRLPETSWAPEPIKKSPSKDPSDFLPSSTWAPEPESSKPRSEPRKITVRTRDKVFGARASPTGSNVNVNVKVSCNAEVNNRSPMFNNGTRSGGASPLEANSPLPHSGRKKLRKQQRPQSMAVTSSWSHSGAESSSPNSYQDRSFNTPDTYGSYGSHHRNSGPPIPAKIPLYDDNYNYNEQSMVMYNGGVVRDGHNNHHNGGMQDEMSQLSMELRGIDIGGVGDAGNRRIAGRRLLGYHG